ncbi:MAG: hypothetical protein V3U73_01100 [bacterium]
MKNFMRIKQALRVIVIVVLNLLLFQGASANNVVVSNISLTGQNTTSDFTLVQFKMKFFCV